jgi:HSP20 family molecular chaperone IbpA
MSSAIRDVEKLNQRQIETAKRRGERELKTLENAHQSMKTDLKKTHDQEVVDIQNSHHEHINKVAEKKEKVLAEMRSHLQQTKELTEKELKNLKDNSAKEKVETQRKLSTDREVINGEHELYLEEMNDRFNHSARKVNLDGKNRIDEMKSEMNEQYLDLEKMNQNKIQTQTQEFTTRFKTEGNNYRLMKDNQDNQFKKERMSTNVRQQNEMSKMTTVHTNHLEQKDGEFRKGLKDQDLFFEKKFEGQLKRHNETFRQLEEKNKKVVDDLKTNLTKEITKTANRNDDPFFKFETLKPKLKTYEDRVEVQVEVPEHSKQDVQLTINGKEAIVSFNRRFADASKEMDGTINKVNKVESFTTRLQTGHFLNAKSLKSSYDNGVMTYVIKKA